MLFQNDQHRIRRIFAEIADACLIDGVGACTDLHLHGTAKRPVLQLFEVERLPPQPGRGGVDGDQHPGWIHVGGDDEPAMFGEPVVAEVALQVVAVKIAAKLGARFVNIAAGAGAAMGAPLVKRLKVGDFAQMAAQGAIAAVTLGMRG